MFKIGGFTLQKHTATRGGSDRLRYNVLKRVGMIEMSQCKAERGAV